MGRREDAQSQDGVRGGHGDPNGFLRQEDGSSRARVQVSQRQRPPLRPSQQTPPTTHRARPSTLAAERKPTSCLHLAMATQARHKGKGARPETTQQGLWEETRPQTLHLHWARGRNGGAVWQADTSLWQCLGGRRGHRQGAGVLGGYWAGREQWPEGGMPLMPCWLWGRDPVGTQQRGRAAILANEVPLTNTQLRSAQFPPRTREGGRRPHAAPGILGQRAAPPQTM